MSIAPLAAIRSDMGILDTCTNACTNDLKERSALRHGGLGKG
jgi:hypothetical protein